MTLKIITIIIIKIIKFETYRIRIAIGFNQLGTPTGSFRVCPGGDATAQRRERDAQ